MTSEDSGPGPRRKWPGFTSAAKMWPDHADALKSLVRALTDTVHVNYRVVDSDLMFEYIWRYVKDLPRTSPILDAGGGWGRLALPLVVEGFPVTVLDDGPYVAEGRRVAERLGVGDGIRFVEEDLKSAKLEPESVEVVLLLEVMEYFPDTPARIALLHSLLAALRPGGLLIATAVDKVAMANLQYRRLLFPREIPDLLDSGQFPDLRGYLFRPVTPSQFDAVLDGLEGVEVVDRRTLLHLDSVLQTLGGLNQTLFYYAPDLPARLLEANLKLMDDPDYRGAGFFHAAVVRKLGPGGAGLGSDGRW